MPKIENSLRRKKILSKARRIRLVILDVDGVLTEGSIIYGMSGREDFEVKVFNAHDGFGICRAIRSGLPVCIISGRESRIVERRAEELGVKDLFQGFEEKLPAYERIKRRYRLKDDEIAYMGDDVPDIALLKKVGLSAATKNALPEVKRSVDYISKLGGGQGAAREFIDLILHAQRKIA